MSHIGNLLIEVRDKNLVRLGQIAPGDQDFLIEDQFNNLGSWTLTLRSDHPMADHLRTPGAGIIVSPPTGDPLMSGPVTLTELKTTIQDPQGTLVVNGVTDTTLLADEPAFPEPSNADAETQTESHDVRTGAAETLMHEYVDANLGPSAPAGRRVGMAAHLTMGTDGARGVVQTKRARFPVLGELLSELALNSNLGFRVIQVGDNLEFQTYEVRDRSAEVRFDMRNQMLSGHSVQTAPPGITRAIVAGQGDLVDRTFVEVSTAESVAAEALWGRRIQRFIDQRNTDDNAELTKAGQEALEEAGFAQLGAAVVPMESIGVEAYGHEWQIGDTVTVVVDGVELVALVTGYVLKNNSEGLKFGAILGDPRRSSKDAAITAAFTKVESRISNLERNAEGGTAIVEASDTHYWNGSAYVHAPTARHYVGPGDPGSVADGSTWDETDTAIRWARVGGAWVKAPEVDEAEPEAPPNTDPYGFTSECDTYTGWTMTGTRTIESVSDATGGHVWRIAGQGSFIHSGRIPYDPTSVYRIRYRVRQTADGTATALERRFFAGLMGFAADGVTMVNIVGANSAGSQFYVSANGVTLNTADGWRECVGYLWGSAATGTVTGQRVAPGLAHSSVRYITPYGINNFGAAGATGAVTEIDSITVEVLPDTGQGWGLVAMESSTSNVATITSGTEAIVAQKAFVPQPGRAYKVGYRMTVSSTVAGSRFQPVIRLTNVTGTNVNDYGVQPVPIASLAQYSTGWLYLRRSGTATTSTTLCLTLIATGGDMTVGAQASRPRFFEIEDIGLASAYPNAPEI